jgi:acetylornithine deacetylase
VTSVTRGGSGSDDRPLEGVAELTGQLVAIDSINPDLVPGARGETAIASFVVDWLRDAGLDVELVEPEPGRPSVVATLRGSGGGRSLMLNAHLDTVGVADMAHPFEPRVEGARLYGRGAYDMKGSLAAIMLTARELRREGRLRGDLLVTAVADEEVASLGTSAVAGRWRADAAIVTEPTELSICLAHKGFVWLEVETSGVAAHGSRPDLGVDAIVKMGRVLVGLEDLAARLPTASPHSLLGHGSVHAGSIEGGRELSTYPDRCVLRVERRTLPGESPTVVQSELQAIVKGSGDVRVLLARDPSEVSPGHPIVQVVREAATERLRTEPPEVGVSYWMDAAILTGAGIPTVTFGPAGEGAHAPVEWVDLGSVAACVDVYVAAARKFCG